MEVRVHLGINWLRLKNMDEAMVLPPCLLEVDDRDTLGCWRMRMLILFRIYSGM